MTCIFSNPSRADTQGFVISPAQAAQKEEEEKYVNFYNFCVVENPYVFLVNE